MKFGWTQGIILKYEKYFSINLKTEMINDTKMELCQFYKRYTAEKS